MLNERYTHYIFIYVCTHLCIYKHCMYVSVLDMEPKTT